MIVLILFWLICTVLSASMLLAHAQREFTSSIAKEYYREDLAFSWFMGLLAGPITLVAVFFLTGFARHGHMNPFVWNKYNSKK